jgi:DNA-directed RNA polymerase subunit K/omega
MKIRYDSRRTQLDLKFENDVYLKLHKEYNQSELINRKFAKQRFESVMIIEKINKLVYKLDISQSWNIHSVISITHLKSTSIEKDSYDKEKKESKSIEDVQKNIKDIYEVKRVLAKRFIKIERARHSKIQYRVKWKEWDDHHNQWIDAANMKNVKNAVNEFEQNSISQINNEQWSHSFIKTSSAAISHLQIKFIAHIFSIAHIFLIHQANSYQSESNDQSLRYFLKSLSILNRRSSCLQSYKESKIILWIRIFERKVKHRWASTHSQLQW